MAKTIQQLAEELSRAFVTDKRDNGDKFVKLKDGSPEWMTDVIRECHAGTLPDDTIYRLIEKCADQLSEMKEDADSGDAYEAITEIEADIYTHELLAWLNGNVDYMTQALEEGEYKDGYQLLMAAQHLHIEEIGNTLVSELETLAGNSEDESEVRVALSQWLGGNEIVQNERKIQLVKFDRCDGEPVSGYTDGDGHYHPSDFGVQVLDSGDESLMSINDLDGEKLNGNYTWDRWLHKKAPAAILECLEGWF